MTFTYKLEYLTVFLEKVIPMGVEICSRSGYPATECNFLSKLCIHSDIYHFGIPTSFFRKLTWKHSDKTLKPICHSEKPRPPVSFQYFCHEVLSSTWEEHGGAAEAPNSLIPPAGRLELPARGPQRCPGGAWLRWGSLPGYSLFFGLTECSAVALCSSTARNTRYSFPELRAAKYLWAHLREHRSFVRVHTPHPFHRRWQFSPCGVCIPSLLSLSHSCLITKHRALHSLYGQALPPRGETSSGAQCTRRATAAALTLQIYSGIAEILPTAAFRHCWLVLSLCNGPPSFLSHPVADHHPSLSHSHR